jgi:SAM-dependent methyltransferase
MSSTPTFYPTRASRREAHASSRVTLRDSVVGVERSPEQACHGRRRSPAIEYWPGGGPARDDALKENGGREAQLLDVDIGARVAPGDRIADAAASPRSGMDVGRDVELSVADAQRLDFPDVRFDTVVFSLALCSIPDDRAAVREATRVLRPGGRLLAIEHVRSPRRSVLAVERVIDSFTTRLQGDHMLREPLDHLRAEGFELEEVERSKLGFIGRIAARKPG